MDQRYTVYIEGRPLVISSAASAGALPEQWLLLRVDGRDELTAAVKSFTKTAAFSGMLLFNSDVEGLWRMFRANYRSVPAAGGAVVDEQGRLLVIRRLGKWDLPKGKVEKGEAVDEAAIREVNEECGLKELRIIGVLPATWHTYERKGEAHLKRTDWFLMQGSSEERLVPQHEEDIEEVRWVPVEELPSIKADTYPSLLPVFEAWEQAVR